MAGVETNSPAPEFTLNDFNGIPVSLSDYKGTKNILLVLNRGFL